MANYHGFHFVRAEVSVTSVLPVSPQKTFSAKVTQYYIFQKWRKEHLVEGFFLKALWPCLKSTERLPGFLWVLYCWHWICSFTDAIDVGLADGSTLILELTKSDLNPFLLPRMSYMTLVKFKSTNFPFLYKMRIVIVPISQYVVTVTHLHWSFLNTLLALSHLVYINPQIMLLLFLFYKLKRKSLRYRCDSFTRRWWSQTAACHLPHLLNPYS